MNVTEISLGNSKFSGEDVFHLAADLRIISTQLADSENVAQIIEIAQAFDHLGGIMCFNVDISNIEFTHGCAVFTTDSEKHVVFLLSLRKEFLEIFAAKASTVITYVIGIIIKVQSFRGAANESKQVN